MSEFLLQNAKEFGFAGVFVAAFVIYLMKKMWTAGKQQAARIKELEGYANGLEQDYREYIKDSLPPGPLSDSLKESIEMQKTLVIDVKLIAAALKKNDCDHNYTD